ncbi:hypothetical protein PRIPAC_90137, partial [Pristionchus pacificus]|uniref:Uncharacterized protein n=1 Tax=Pristionchus pacificus TaxID=54126 RepID=A0A2A6CZB4_PRIPA
MPTRKDNILDLVLTTDSHLLSSLFLSPGLADHVNFSVLAIPTTDRGVDWMNALVNGDSTQRMYDRFISIVHQVINECIPITSNRPTHSRFILNLIRIQSRLFSNNDPSYDTFSKKVRVAIRREAIRREGKRILTSNGGLFSNMRGLSKQKAAVSALRNIDGTFASSPSDKAEALSSQFSSVFTVDNGITPPFPSRTASTIETLD